MKNRMNLCHVDLRHAQTTKTTKRKEKTIQDYLGGSSVPTGIITPVRVNELIPRECFCMLHNEGSVVPATCYLLPVPYITFCDFLQRSKFDFCNWYKVF
jgi:hydroxymethylglutaryl-CoA reductase